MNFVIKNGMPLVEFQSFSIQTGVLHYISTRQGGVSRGAYGSLNLSCNATDKANGRLNRNLLAGALGISPEKMIFPMQCHLDNIKNVNSQTLHEDLDLTDALVTATPGLCIGVLTADCVPVLLYDRKLHTAGVAHAGWRGTISRIAAKTVSRMVSEFNSNPFDIIAGIGPSISVDNYEVGEEVIEKVIKAFDGNKGLIKPSTLPHKAFFDLWEANKLQLVQCGLQPENIEIAGICTYDNSGTFFSARKSGPDSGRFGAGIMLI